MGFDVNSRPGSSQIYETREDHDLRNIAVHNLNRVCGGDIELISKVVQTIRRDMNSKDGDFFEVLDSMGVGVKLCERRVLVSDSMGVFTFEDDDFHTGVKVLFGDICLIAGVSLPITASTPSIDCEFFGFATMMEYEDELEKLLRDYLAGGQLDELLEFSGGEFLGIRRIFSMRDSLTVKDLDNQFPDYCDLISDRDPETVRAELGKLLRNKYRGRFYDFVQRRTVDKKCLNRIGKQVKESVDFDNLLDRIVCEIFTSDFARTDIISGVVKKHNDYRTLKGYSQNKIIRGKTLKVADRYTVYEIRGYKHHGHCDICSTARIQHPVKGVNKTFCPACLCERNCIALLGTSKRIINRKGKPPDSKCKKNARKTFDPVYLSALYSDGIISVSKS